MTEIGIFNQFLKNSLKKPPTDEDSNMHYGIIKEGQVLSINLVGLHKNVIPEMIGEFKHIERIKLGGWLDEKMLHFTSLPMTLGNLETLKELEIWNANISKLPDSFGKLKNLESLTIINNNLEVLPTSFCDLHQLKYLHLSHNKLKYLPANFADLSELENLFIDSNQLTDFPTTICNLHSLKTLDIRKNLITYLPDCLEKLQNLRHFSYRENPYIDYEKIKQLVDKLPHISKLKGSRDFNFPQM